MQEQRNNVKISYGIETVNLTLGCPQTDYKGPRGPGASVKINGISGYCVSNWGPEYLSFRKKRDYMIFKYSSPGFTKKSAGPWGTITSITFGTLSNK